MFRSPSPPLQQIHSSDAEAKDMSGTAAAKAELYNTRLLMWCGTLLPD
jgi:hypothetical protein